MARRQAVPLQKPRDARKAVAVAPTTDDETPTLKRHGAMPDRWEIEGKLQDVEGVLAALAIVVWEKCNVPGMHGVMTLVQVAQEKTEVLRNTIYPDVAPEEQHGERP